MGSASAMASSKPLRFCEIGPCPRRAFEMPYRIPAPEAKIDTHCRRCGASFGGCTHKGKWPVFRPTAMLRPEPSFSDNLRDALWSFSNSFRTALGA